MTPEEKYAAKQELASPARYYGGIGTIHNNTELDVETDIVGRVVAVWFRCQMLPFNSTRVDAHRAREMREAQANLPRLTGVEVLDADA